MSIALDTPPADGHALSTRLVHAALALSICTQLATSLLMEGPDEASAGDVLFQIHRYSGLAALALAVLFWMTLALRRRGTAPAALFPWFSGPRRRALRADVAAHLRAVARFRLPANDESGPLASAVHGLGLLLMTAMAVSGGVYAAGVWAGLQSPEPDDALAMTVHFALANLVWAYLIAHAGMATLHHLAGASPLRRMWRLRG